jgi:hypothetical protein
MIRAIWENIVPLSTPDFDQHLKLLLKIHHLKKYIFSSQVIVRKHRVAQ